MRRNPPEIVILLGQNSLSQDVGGKQVTIDQAKYLLQVARYPHVALRIVPNHSGWHPGLETDFSLIEAPKPTTGRRPVPQTSANLDSIVFVGTRRTVLMLHEEPDVAAYRWAIGSIAQIALTEPASLRYIGDLVKRMEHER